ncbi:MAG: hypothetical protein JSW61_03080 [Candidatus Thorarchaeota archaeon]|nr:MAG: hypothetical protein JSW61_03080 [Candidatus Thorarchaeota archaeon]
MTYPQELRLNPVHPKNMTKDDWLTDLETLFRLMKQSNPYISLKERTHGYAWLDLLRGYRDRMQESESTLEYLDVLFDAVQALQNRHTIILIPDWLYDYYDVEEYRTKEPYCHIFTDKLKEYYAYWEPIIEEYFKHRIYLNFDVFIVYNNGEYLIATGHGSWEKRYGKRTIVTAVNGIPIDEAIQGCYEKGFLDWDFKREKHYLWKIAPRHFGPDAEFTIRRKSGEEKQVVFPSGYDFPYPYATIKYPVPRLETRTWPKRGAAYIRIGDFSDGMFEEDSRVLLDFYKQIEDYRLLIIDVRGNEGGSYLPWMTNVISPLAKKTLSSRMHLAFRSGAYVEMFRETADIGSIVSKDVFDELPPEVLADDFTIYDYTQTVGSSGEFDFKGKIVLLIDGETFSATDAFALFCKETGFAKLYGTPTGGDGISDSPIYYILPNSKLVVRFTPGMGIDYTGSANEETRVQPDVYYESEFADLNSLVNHVIKKEL